MELLSPGKERRDNEQSGPRPEEKNVHFPICCKVPMILSFSYALVSIVHIEDTEKIPRRDNMFLL